MKTQKIAEPVTLQYFLDKCAFGGPIVKDIRQGQWCFNCLQEYRPDLADICRGTTVDPFYNDG